MFWSELHVCIDVTFCQYAKIDVDLLHGGAALTANIRDHLTGFGSAGWKQGVDANWSAQASSRYIDSARSYAQSFQNYVARAPQPEPNVVKEIKAELGRYLDDAQKHLVAMKKDYASDKETVVAVENIEKDLATAIAHNKDMIACCENQKFDKVATMTCCTDLTKDLNKVHGEHIALMNKLAAKYPAAGTTR